MKLEYVKHSFPPYYESDSEILILGSIPSVISRQEKFYYMHPENRFWKTLGLVYKTDIGKTIKEKKQFLKDNKIALWDVIESCLISGSSDSSIKDVKPTDINSLLSKTNIKKIYTTGNKAYQLYNKYSYPLTKREALLLPSTSSANAKWRLDDLVKEYQVLLNREGENND